MRAVPDLTLSRRLLSAIAATAPGQPADSTTLAQSAGARLGAVNRALTHLAEEGLIEGLWTGAQWTLLTLTPRDRTRARTPRSAAVDRPHALSRIGSSAAATRDRMRPAAAAVARELAAAAQAIPPALRRLKSRAAPRAAALRLRAAKTFRLFTSFP